jgi:hypothetical protein
VQGASLDTLQSVMTEIRRRYPQNSDVLVVPLTTLRTMT